MTKQLTLVNTSHRPRPHSWRLDDQTREIGRKGLVSARAALMHARRPGQQPSRATTRAGSPPGARDRPAA